MSQSNSETSSSITQHHTQHPDSDYLRSPFKPVRKVGSSLSPTSIHVVPAHVTLGEMGPPRTPRAAAGNVGGQSAAVRPLQTSTAHNIPSISLPFPSTSSGSSPTDYRTSVRKVLPSSSSITSATSSSSSDHLNTLPPSSSAPRIRARLTPSATPRKKPVLLGTEFADVVTPGTARVLLRKALPSTPATSSIFGPGPGVRRGEDEMGVLRNGMGGLNIGGIGACEEDEEERRVRGGKDNVLVCVRIRPPAAKLAAAAHVIAEDAWAVNPRTGSVALKNGNPTEFIFDSVVTGSENKGVYEEAGKELVLAAMEGFDAVIFAYGQTASGKTFTLSGNSENPGIIPQAVTEIFSFIRDHPEKEFLLRASYLEIYNETLKDLLAPESGPLKIRQDENKKFFVSPLREEVVTGEAQVAALLKRGEENRHTGRTDFNERSSRSHSVFQMTIESRLASTSPSTTSSVPLCSKTPNGPRLAPGSNGAVSMSRLSLIDLAGSEQATSQTERRSEGAFINKSLLTLEKVIASLTDDSKRKPHVPYRDSKLTQILQPSLSGDARVSVIATMNPSSAAIEETKSTLKFAQRVKKVVLSAKVNEVVDDKALIHKYRNHCDAKISILEAQLQEAMAAVPATPRSGIDHTLKNEADKAEIVRLNKALVDLKSLFLTSFNIEDRRHSTMPPRPVSPTKKIQNAADTIEENFEEKFLDCQDELASRLEEIDLLQVRMKELESLPSSTHLLAAATESEKDRMIQDLLTENRELKVVQRNSDFEQDLKRQEKKFERMLERCTIYEKDLEESLEKERSRVRLFERYILQHMSSSTQAPPGHSTSTLTGTSRASLHPANNHTHRYRQSSIGGFTNRPILEMGFSPLMSETPSLDLGAHFVELEDLEFSEEGRKIVQSGSMMFN